MPADSVSDLVSVVIPTYHGERFIAEALANVATQTWPHWELLVVEDGTTGPTEGIVRQFAGQHPDRRIEYFRHETNQSQSAARNTGMNAARGQFIALLDVDDRWQPTHLAACMAALREGAELAYSTVAMFDDETDLIFGTWGPTKKDLAQFPQSLMNRSFLAPSAVVFRRDILERVGLFLPPLSPCEDFDFWIRCAAAGVRFTHLTGCHVLYRKNHAEAQTRGTCRLTEAFAKVIDKHQKTFPTKRSFNKLAARLYFGAAWCHATTSREQDPTADPSRVPALLQRATELHRGRLQYMWHSALFRWRERWNSELLGRLHVGWLRPWRFARIGNLMTPPTV